MFVVAARWPMTVSGECDGRKVSASRGFNGSKQGVLGLLRSYGAGGDNLAAGGADRGL